jgi:predicted ATPase
MLKKLMIKNFKCFTDVEIGFSPLTLLVGPNGAGKSTVIQALLMSKQSAERINVENLQDESSINFDVLLNGPYNLQLGQASHVISSNATSKFIEFTLKNKFEQEVNYVYEIDSIYGSALLKGGIRKSSDFRGRENDFPLSGPFSYLGSERLGPRRALEMAPSSFLNVGYQGEYVSHVMRLADIEEVRLNEELRIEKRLAKFSDQVIAWLNTIIPNIDVNYEVIEKMNMVSLGYKNNILNTEYVSASNTGFGITYVLPIIVEGLLLSTKSNPVFIVENPEAHLHPYSQSKIGRFLALLSLQGVQIIIETHSEHVVNGCRLELLKSRMIDQFTINFISQTEGIESSIQPITLNKYGELSKWPSGFFDQEEQDMREILMLRREIGKES